MLDNGNSMNERVEKSIVPMIKIIETVHTNKMVYLIHSKDVDKFIEMAFKRGPRKQDND